MRGHRAVDVRKIVARSLRDVAAELVEEIWPGSTEEERAIAAVLERVDRALTKVAEKLETEGIAQ